MKNHIQNKKDYIEWEAKEDEDDQMSFASKDESPEVFVMDSAQKDMAMVTPDVGETKVQNRPPAQRPLPPPRNLDLLSLPNGSAARAAIEAKPLLFSKGYDKKKFQKITSKKDGTYKGVYRIMACQHLAGIRTIQHFSPVKIDIGINEMPFSIIEDMADYQTKIKKVFKIEGRIPMQHPEDPLKPCLKGGNGGHAKQVRNLIYSVDQMEDMGQWACNWTKLMNKVSTSPAMIYDTFFRYAGDITPPKLLPIGYYVPLKHALLLMYNLNYDKENPMTIEQMFNKLDIVVDFIPQQYMTKAKIALDELLGNDNIEHAAEDAGEVNQELDDILGSI